MAGGTDTADNLRILCDDCNYAKGADVPDHVEKNLIGSRRRKLHPFVGRTIVVFIPDTRDEDGLRSIYYSGLIVAATDSLAVVQVYDQMGEEVLSLDQIVSDNTLLFRGHFEFSVWWAERTLNSGSRRDTEPEKYFRYLMSVMGYRFHEGEWFRKGAMKGPQLHRFPDCFTSDNEALEAAE
jgi:hypothetical protein